VETRVAIPSIGEPPMRVLIVSDAWLPQVNGVVRSLQALAAAAAALGADIEFLTPQGFRSVALPLYADIRLSLTTATSVGQRIASHDASHVHLATEGPLGFAARRYCRHRGLPFTTSYHTRFPEYLAARIPIPTRWVYGMLKSFHNAGSGTFVTTDSLKSDLQQRGFTKLMRWSLGVDHVRFHPRATRVLDVPGPIFLYVGRIAVEKNLRAFLDIDLPGTKVLVGDGPSRAALESAYPAALFLGVQEGERLAEIYSSADVFVFPSLTDTFGLVLLEAMACGVPVAGFPTPANRDVVGGSGAGALSADLRQACLAALDIPRWKPLARAQVFSWQRSAAQFLRNLEIAAAAGASGIGLGSDRDPYPAAGRGGLDGARGLDSV